MRRVDDFLCEGLRFYHVPGIAMAYQGMRRGRFINNFILDCGRDGITGGPYLEWPLEDIHVSGNLINGVGDDAIAVHAYADSATRNTQGRPHRIAIVGNTIFGQGSYIGAATTASMTAGSAAVTGSGFTSSDVNKFMAVPGAGASGITHISKIASFQVDTQVTLADAASVTVTNVTVNYSNGAGRGIFLHGLEDSTCTGNVVDSTFSHGISVAADTTSGNGPGGVGGWRNRNVAITGNVVRRGGAVGDATQPRWGIRFTGSDNCTVSGNTVSDSPAVGVYCSDISGCHVDGNHVHDNGTLITDYGIDLDGVSEVRNVIACTVNGNILTGNKGGGIRSYYTVRAQVNNNLSYNNGTAGAGTNPNGAGILIRTDNSATVSGNNCYDSRNSGSKTQTHGIHVGVGGDLTFVGNDLLGNNGSGIDLATTPTVFIKRGNKESGTTRSNYDQDYAGVRRMSGAGTPEGVVAAPVGSVYFRSDGGAATTLYVKESGTGNTGWSAK
ncbi:right-handed parallel beta-helix repeat-containing protein [Arthrobacter sp. 24S4-2]|uniref:right-handed parallel beta-helix repeat-containing protein n=1 Tax=Arthrobacter sp. 24S4-2 TaxID=2575374 RepID=UPI0010C7DAAC|nr:right-handed parallel beta-helix repeat-containing protein [Arthrobacter sp. 24S4-2]QCO99588.1 right-handed parallel beta-helix repeat-containing protein [Arthrobacter sp. 24S4-2]